MNESIKESNFQSKVVKWLKEHNFYTIKYNASGMSNVGVPDVITCMHGLFVAIEIKKEKGIVSPLQLYNIKKINQGEGMAIVLKPSQFTTFKNIVNEQYNHSHYDVRKEMLEKIGVD